MAAGQLPWDRAIFLFPAQLLAALAAGGLVQCMFPWDVGETNTILATNVSISQGVFIEMFLASQLMFVVLMLAAEKQKATYLAPIAIGIVVFGIMICGECIAVEGFISDAEHPTDILNRWLLHWSFYQPSPQSWLGCRRQKFPRLSLDLLGWSCHGRCSWCNVLSLC